MLNETVIALYDDYLDSYNALNDRYYLLAQESRHPLNSEELKELANNVEELLQEYTFMVCNAFPNLFPDVKTARDESKQRWAALKEIKGHNLRQENLGTKASIAYWRAKAELENEEVIKAYETYKELDTMLSRMEVNKYEQNKVWKLIKEMRR